MRLGSSAPEEALRPNHYLRLTLHCAPDNMFIISRLWQTTASERNTAETDMARLLLKTSAWIALSGLIALSGCSDADEQGARQYTKIPLPHPKESVVAPVKPPKRVWASPDARFIPEEEFDKLPIPKQPAVLSEKLMTLTEGSIDERIEKLRQKVIKDLVFVKGGTFQMGDFASIWIGEGQNYSFDSDDKPAREVTLSDFWISRYKTSYAEFDVFTDATRRPRNGMKFNGKYRHPLLPAGTYWQQAKDYCHWLGDITGQPFDLPTEAQWEYAARSRGQFFAVATDNGNVEYGRNLPHFDHLSMMSMVGTKSRYPVGIFPPNPLGIYDMAHNEMEWVNDWYGKNAYSEMVDVDPTGPEAGSEKVLRGWPSSDGLTSGGTVWRRHWSPDMLEIDHSADEEPIPTYLSPAVRCAVYPLSKDD